MHPNQEGQSLHLISDEIVLKLKEIVERDARYST